MTTWADRAYVAGAICLGLLPFALSVLSLLWRNDLAPLPLWRYRVSTAGTLLAFFASVPLPLFYVTLTVLPMSERTAWLPRVSMDCFVAGLLAGLLAVVMLCFARGRVRWSGILSATLSVAFIYVALMALSF
jgi:hypothetical protein